jgi:peptidoglycan/LPS O-acetylase OafA/YrhL
MAVDVFEHAVLRDSDALPRATGRARPFLPALTGIRAFAAFWVLALHMTGVIGALAPPPFAAAFARMSRPGFLGVDVFFVLSGFIISYNYAHVFDRGIDAKQWGRFLWARLARIYPVHIVLLAALAVAVLGFGFGRGGAIADRRWSLGALVESALLVHAWLGHKDVWNAVSWSISSEWLAYVCFPLLSLAALGIVRRPGTVMSWITLAILTVLPACNMAIGRATGAPMLPPLQILSEFLAGCIVYRLFVRGDGVRGPALRPGLTLLGLIGMAMALDATNLPVYWAVVLVPPIVLGLARQHGRASRVFSHPIAVYWGKVSFALYMTHYLWLWVMHTFLPLDRLAVFGFLPRVAFVSLHFLPALLIASATYHLLEEPARRALARVVERPAAPGTAAGLVPAAARPRPAAAEAATGAATS